MGARRLLRAHMRLCGAMHSCTEAKAGAEALLKAAFHTLYNSDLARRAELQLKWRAFAGLEAMPLHHTDIFIVYCRSVPVEYACVSPSQDLLLSFPFPPSCRQRHQTFALVSIRSLLTPKQADSSTSGSRAASRGDNAGAARKPRRRRTQGQDSSDEEEDYQGPEQEAHSELLGQPASSQARQQQMCAMLLDPTYLRELAAFVELQATAPTRVACVRYHKDAEKVREARAGAGVGAGAGLSQRGSGTLPPFLASTLASEGPWARSGVFPSRASGTPGTARTGTPDGAPKVSLERPTNPNPNPNPNRNPKVSLERPLRSCVVPLYEWLHISEERAQEMDVNRLCLTKAEEAALAHSGSSILGSGTSTGTGLAGVLMVAFAEMGLRHEARSKAAPPPEALLLSPRLVRDAEGGAQTRELGRAVTRRMDELDRAKVCQFHASFSMPVKKGRIYLQPNHN